MKCIKVNGILREGRFQVTSVKNVSGTASVDEWHTISQLVRFFNAPDAILRWDAGHWDDNTWG